MNQSQRTKRDEELAKKAGLVKIHPLIPVAKVEEVLAYCRQVREDYFKGKNEL